MIKKEFKRKTGFRDSTLIVIATEGQKTEPQYFDGLRLLYKNPKTHIEVLNRKTSASSPKHVIQELDKFTREYKLNRYDELWLIVDKDRWGDSELSLTIRQCIQKKYNFAVSNPCFELWLLLHLKDILSFTKTEIQKLNVCKKIKEKIKVILGSYNSSNLAADQFISYVNQAISRAKYLDTNINERWSTSLGSRVYLIAEKIIS
ncbi:RloB domain-containing protein [bacterium]|nr:RloB domain-containing protein [bacterium]